MLIEPVVQALRAFSPVENLLRTRPRTDVIAAITHDVLSDRQFTTESDLVEAVKCRCARLHVPYDSGRVLAAITLVARTRPVVVPPARPARLGPPEAFTFAVGRAEAAEIMAMIRRHLRATR